MCWQQLVQSTGVQGTNVWWPSAQLSHGLQEAVFTWQLTRKSFAQSPWCARPRSRSWFLETQCRLDPAGGLAQRNAPRIKFSSVETAKDRDLTPRRATNMALNGSARKKGSSEAFSDSWSRHTKSQRLRSAWQRPWTAQLPKFFFVRTAGRMA